MFAATTCGTFPYSSPELLSLLPYNPLVNDLWSLGVMLYEMLYARLPFGQGNHHEILKKQKNGVYFLTSRSDGRAMPSAEFKDLVVGMLQFNVEERFVMRDVLLHHWTACEFARYEMQRLGLPDGAFQLPSKELTVLPYRLNIEQCNELNRVHNLHHIRQQQYYTESSAPAREHQCGRRNPVREANEGTFHNEDMRFGLKVVHRAKRDEFDWREVYANTPDFGAKKAVLQAINALSHVQNLLAFRCCPAVQDVMSVLDAVLLFYNAGLCTTAQWEAICLEACVQLHFAIRSLDQLKGALEANRQRLLTEKVTLILYEYYFVH